MAQTRQTAALAPDRTHAELQTAAHAIKDHHRQVEESLRAGFSNALSHAIEAGRKLIYAKSLVGHGGWGPWVARNLADIDGRTERLYRQLAEAAADGRLQIGNGVTALSIRKARELLVQAAPAGESTTADSEDGERHYYTPSAATTESEDGERLSRTPLAARLAGQALAPLRAALAEDSEVEYEQLVEALADELEPSSYAGEWVSLLEKLFADVRSELEDRGR
jgi:hypothetical protein